MKLIKNVGTLFLTATVCYVHLSAVATPAPASQGAAKPIEIKDAATAFSALSQSQLPLFAPDGKDKFTIYKQFIVFLSPTTARDVIQNGIQLFLKDVVTRTQSMTDITLVQLEEIMKACELFKGSTSALETRLAPSPDTALKDFLTLSTKEFGTAITSLSKRIEEQKAFNKALDDGLARSNKNLEKIIAELDRLAARITGTLIDALRERYLKVIEENAFPVLERKGKIQEAFKKLIAKLQALSAFNVMEKQRLSQALNPSTTEKVVPLNKPETTGSTKPNELLVAKLKEFTLKKTVTEKCIFLKEVLNIITATSPQEEKNVLIEVINPLFMAYPTYDALSLDALKGFLTTLQTHPFVLTDSHKKIVDTWIKNITLAISLADPKLSLVESVKQKISNIKKEFDLGERALFFSLSLLDAQLPPAEKNNKDMKSLVTVVRQTLPVIYGLRANKKTAQLSVVLQLMNIAAERAEVKDVVKKEWINTLSILISIQTFKSKKNNLEKIEEIHRLVGLFKEGAPRFEVSRVIDLLSTLVANRSDYAAVEIEKLIVVVSDLLKHDDKKFKIFNPKDKTKFQGWKKSLELTLNIQRLMFAKTFDQKIDQAAGVMKTITQATEESERRMFVKFLVHLFSVRGGLIAAELTKLKDFFGLVEKSQNVLKGEQQNVLASWVKDLTFGQKITTGTLTFIQALLQEAEKTKAVDLVTKAAHMIDDATPKESVAGFIKILNTVVTSRTKATVAAVASLLDVVENKMARLLSPEQQIVLNQWLGAADIKSQRDAKKSAGKKAAGKKAADKKAAGKKAARSA